MQTPLIFKLLLLLAFSLRLLKSNKSSVSPTSITYYQLSELISIKKIEIKPDFYEESGISMNKPLYRRVVRNSKVIDVESFNSTKAAEQLIVIAYKFEKYYSKGGLYRFLWHGNEWIIAFGQSLEVINHQASETFKKLISEIGDLKKSNFDYELIDWEKVYPFPDANQQYKYLKQFESEFDLFDYLKLVIETTTFKPAKK